MNEFIEITKTKYYRSELKSVYGVGINDAKYYVTSNLDGIRNCCPYFLRWQNMLKRCYSIKFHENNPTYKGCSVCDEWLTFSNFKTWMCKQDWKGKHLDKDILNFGNKEYSPDTCIFVSSRINGIIHTNKMNRGKYKIGVTFDKSRNKFVAECNIGTGKIMIGRFTTEVEAHNAYVLFKTDLVRKIAIEQVEPLKTALLLFSKNI